MVYACRFSSDGLLQLPTLGVQSDPAAVDRVRTALSPVASDQFRNKWLSLPALYLAQCGLVFGVIRVRFDHNTDDLAGEPLEQADIRRKLGLQLSIG